MFQLIYAALINKVIQQDKLNRCHGCTIQHPGQSPHSCLMMDNDDAWMYHHDEVVETIDLNSVLKTTESVCSALGFTLGIKIMRGERYRAAKNAIFITVFPAGAHFNVPGNAAS